MNIPYPTVIIEVGHRNESWKRLKQDAGTKAFAHQTSIQVLIAIKIYTAHFRVFWASRSMTGVGMKIEQSSPKLDIQTPTNLSITIPKQLVFWGVPPVNHPVTSTPDLILQLETLRVAI